MKRMLFACAALALVAGTGSAEAATLYTQASPSAVTGSPGSVSYSFVAGSGSGLASFDINGIISIDGIGAGGYDDIFTLDLNGTPVYSAGFVLGGGGINQVLLAPAGATQTPTSFGFLGGGIANLTVPLTLSAGSNTLTFSYASAIPQGTGDEAFRISNLTVTGNAFRQTGAVPEPATWAMMIGGFGMVGGSMRSARRRQKLAFAAA